MDPGSAGVAPNLPVPVLLGTDTPKLPMLLQLRGGKVDTNAAFMDTTRASKKQEMLETQVQGAKQVHSKILPKPEEMDSGDGVVPAGLASVPGSKVQSAEEGMARILSE